MKITVTHDDGTEVDVTEAVQVTYDVAYSSMDWGSGFLDSEEMGAIAHLAEAARFPSFEDALASVAQRRKDDEEQQVQRLREEQKRKQREQDASIAQRQLAWEMRQKEPHLADAGWSDAQLARLHSMRNAGLA